MKSLILISIFLTICSQILFAQKVDKMTDLKLRESFTKLFEGDFEIVSDTVKPYKNGIKHWLITLKPKKEGFYTIRHIYKNRKGWGYENNSSEFQISVGSKINARILDYSNSRNLKQAWFDMWLGDEIVVPISLDKNIIENKFSKESRYGADFNFDKEFSRDSYIVKNFLKWEIENNVAELECLGISVTKIPTRNPGYNVSYYANFRATSAGKFNLKIDNNQIVPVTILPQNTPIKTLAGYKAMYEWETGASRSGGDAYLLENATLRIGDLLKIRISETQIRHDFKSGKMSEDNAAGKMMFDKVDFNLKNTGYDYWIED